MRSQSDFVLIKESMAILVTCLLVLAVGGLACSGAPSGPETPSLGRVMAVVSGHFALQYEGDGIFIAPPDKREGFDLVSASVDKDGTKLQLHALGDGVPSPGKYILVTPREQLSSRTSFVAFFRRPVVNSGIEAFASTEGVITITRSDSDVVEGTFKFQARRYCLSFPVETPGAICHNPLDMPLDSPSVTISGQFKAHRSPNEPVPPAI